MIDHSIVDFCRKMRACKVNIEGCLMTTVVIEHVALNELPAAWRARFPVSSRAHVTVCIEEEPGGDSVTPFAQNPLFGLWKDRDDLADVQAYARQLRAPRGQDKG
jgi:hypothetical protein